MKPLSKNAIQILEDRYLLRDARGQIRETPEQMFRRVAVAVAAAQPDNQAAWADRFYQAMTKLLFLPNSPTLMHAGLPGGQLSACFVIPVHDSLTSIFGSLHTAAMVHQSGGGTGFDFSELRHKDDLVSSTLGRSSGPVAFIRIYDCATEYVKQGGKRRGANMGILRIDHPDIEEFIGAKSDKRSLANFNLSVGITDRFMRALEAKEDFGLINPRTKEQVRSVQAEKLWDMIADKAWETGDPGMIFLDAINRNNPTPSIGPICSTNPCGEVPLLPYESCNLGSINLSMMTRGGGNKELDWHKLQENIALGIRFLDNVISVNHYLLPEIRQITLANRKVGLGVMGWADLLIRLGIPYASEQALELGDRLMRFVSEESRQASELLARERGCFPNWAKSIHYPQREMRNATCNSIAPTGTISVIANASYSIEPIYGLAFKRTGILGGKTQLQCHGIFEEHMKRLGLWNSSFRAKVLSGASVNELPEVPERVRPLYLTSLEIPWKFHLLHQKAFQEHTDNAVSKTINLPEETSRKEIRDIFHKAWKYGLKGVTVYRDGSKEGQVLQKCNLGLSSSC